MAPVEQLSARFGDEIDVAENRLGAREIAERYVTEFDMAIHIAPNLSRPACSRRHFSIQYFKDAIGALAPA